MLEFKYPYTDTSVLNLDWFLEQFKLLVEEWRSTEEQWAVMQQNFQTLEGTVQTFTTFVENYFENLDVQQEINNKLDQMALDGTLSTLLAPLVDDKLPGVVDTKLPSVVADQLSNEVAQQLPAEVAAQIDDAVAPKVPPAVTSWLDDNVNPVGSAVTIDSSLTITGSAADAKVVGDKFDVIEETIIPIEDVFEWIDGYYRLNTGVIRNIVGTYHATPIQDGSVTFSYDSPSSLPDYRDYISYWNQGVYLGYFMDNKWYDPTSTETTEFATYDQWALNKYSSGVFDPELYKPNSLQSRVEDLESYAGRYKHLENLSIGFLGDSITVGVGASDTAHSYVGLMNKEFADVKNYGKSGCLIANESGFSNPMCLRYNLMSDDLDIVVVYGGTNDWYYGTAWGTVDSIDDTTFLGALNVLMSGLVEKYCGKEIFFVTPMSSDFHSYNTDDQNACGKTMLDYRNAIIERATYHAIPVIDLYGMCNMDVAHNAANKTYYSSDGVHPNDAGHKRVHDRIVTFISNILY